MNSIPGSAVPLVMFFFFYSQEEEEDVMWLVGWLAGERQFLGKSSCRATSAPLTPNQYSMNIQLVFKKTFDPFL